MARHQNRWNFCFRNSDEENSFVPQIWISDLVRFCSKHVNWGRVCGTLQKKLVIGEHQNPGFQKMITGTARRQQDVGIGRVIFEKIAARMISWAEMPTAAQGSQGKEVCEQDVTYILHRMYRFGSFDSGYGAIGATSPVIFSKLVRAISPDICQFRAAGIRPAISWAPDLLYHWVFRNQPPQFFCNRTILAYKILKTAPISKMSRTTLKLRLRVFGIEHYSMIFNVLGLPCYYVFWNRRPKIS